MKTNILVFFAVLYLLTACATNNSQPINTYSIASSSFQSTAQQQPEQKGALIIKLAPLRSMPSLSGTSIQYSDSQHGHNSYAYSRWSDAPVKMLQVLFQQTLERTGQFAAVVSPTSALREDWLLEGTLYDFSHHLHKDGTSSGVIKVRFYLVDKTTKIVIATKELHAQEPATSQNAKAAVAGLSRAALAISHDLAQWLSERACL